jgi:hypothetical protein
MVVEWKDFGIVLTFLLTVRNDHRVLFLFLFLFLFLLAWVDKTQRTVQSVCLSISLSLKKEMTSLHELSSAEMKSWSILYQC